MALTGLPGNASPPQPPTLNLHDLQSPAAHHPSDSMSQATSQDYQARVKAIQAQMTNDSVTIALLDQPECVHYFTGYSVSEGCQQFCVIPRAGQPYMVLRSADRGGCDQHSWLPRENISTFNDWQDPIQFVHALCIEKALTSHDAEIRIAIDEQSYALTPARHRQLMNIIAPAKPVDYSKFLTELQCTKSDREIALIQRAADIATPAIEHIAALARVGTTTRWLTSNLAAFIISKGGDPGITGVVTHAPADTNMHPTPDDKPIETGDLLFIEAIVQISGYTARTMRTVSCGQPSEAQRAAASDIIRFQDQQFSTMRPGAKAAEVDASLRNAILDARLKDQYPNITGYQLGYYQLFTSRSSNFSLKFDPNADWILDAGMVFHMYVVAKGLAFSETVLVTEDGYKRLTLADRKIYSTPDDQSTSVEDISQF